MAKQLGRSQIGCLEGLKEHGGWERNCGWLWRSQSETERVMESLADRGFVKKFPKTGELNRKEWKYRIGPKGVDELNRLKMTRGV